MTSPSPYHPSVTLHCLRIKSLQCGCTGYCCSITSHPQISTIVLILCFMDSVIQNADGPPWGQLAWAPQRLGSPLGRCKSWEWPGSWGLESSGSVFTRISGGQCWLSAGVSAGAADLSNYMWPLHVAWWPEHQYGGLRLVGLCGWWLSTLKASGPVDKAEVALTQPRKSQSIHPLYTQIQGEGT